MTKEEQQAVERFTKTNLTKKHYNKEEMQDAFIIGMFQGQKMKPSVPIIKGWVARDDDLKHIHLFHNKPLRDKWTWHCGYPALQLPDEIFPELKWEDEPIEVELQIKPL